MRRRGLRRRRLQCLLRWRPHPLLLLRRTTLLASMTTPLGRCTTRHRRLLPLLRRFRRHLTRLEARPLGALILKMEALRLSLHRRRRPSPLLSLRPRSAAAARAALAGPRRSPKPSRRRRLHRLRRLFPLLLMTPSPMPPTASRRRGGPRRRPRPRRRPHLPRRRRSILTTLRRLSPQHRLLHPQQQQHRGRRRRRRRTMTLPASPRSSRRPQLQPQRRVTTITMMTCRRRLRLTLARLHACGLTYRG